MNYLDNYMYITTSKEWVGFGTVILLLLRILFGVRENYIHCTCINAGSRICIVFESFKVTNLVFFAGGEEG